MTLQEMQLWIWTYRPDPTEAPTWAFFTGADVKVDGLVHLVGLVGTEMLYYSAETDWLDDIFRHESYQREWLVNLSDEQYVLTIKVFEEALGPARCAGSEEWGQRVVSLLWKHEIITKKEVDRIEEVLGFQPKPASKNEWFTKLLHAVRRD